MQTYYDILRQLGANNNRPWFAEHKAEIMAYREQWADQLQVLIDLSVEVWPELNGVKARDCMYRIYRDTRFSPDKTPYKTYFSASISPRGRQWHDAGIYIQAGPRGMDSGVYGGVWCPDAAELKRLRSAIDGADDEFLEIARDLESNPAFENQWCGAKLKTAPKGWPKDHPMIKYLRLKDIGMLAPMDEAMFTSPEWPEYAAKRVADLMPLVRFLNYRD